jgi:hypothetical protein
MIEEMFFKLPSVDYGMAACAAAQHPARRYVAIYST